MEVKRLFDVLHYQKENHPQQVAIATIKDGNWWKVSTDELISMSNNMSLGLLKLGIQKGDKGTGFDTAFKHHPRPKPQQYRHYRNAQKLGQR